MAAYGRNLHGIKQQPLEVHETMRQTYAPKANKRRLETKDAHTHNRPFRVTYLGFCMGLASVQPKDEDNGQQSMPK